MLTRKHGQWREAQHNICIAPLRQVEGRENYEGHKYVINFEVFD